MPAPKLPFTKEEFDAIYRKVPRLTVEVIIRNDKGEIFMTKRAIEPCKGQWHLPGGTVFFAESLADAVKRVAERELGISVIDMKHVGYIEYPSHYKHGLDTPVGIAFEVTNYKGNIRLNKEAEGSGWFAKLPANTHADQDTFLISGGYLAV